MGKAGGAAGSNEPFGHQVRQPGSHSRRVIAEHEPLPHRLEVAGAGGLPDDGPVLGHDSQGVGVQGNPVGASGLGGAQLWSVGSFDQGTHERDRSTREVDICPPQRQ